MRPPTRSVLQQRGRSFSYAAGLHPCPASYKHVWQIFTLKSPWEGEDFLEHAPKLSTAQCFQRLEELDAQGVLFILYGRKVPRRSTGMPFDPLAARWRDATWAPALEDDPDPAWHGHR